MIEDDLYGVYEEDDEEINYIFVGTKEEAEEFILKDLKEKGLI